MTPLEKIRTLYQTLHWLETNPDKSIEGAMARDADGNRCRPQNPNAVCFCFAGRLVRDLWSDEKLSTNSSLENWLASIGASASGLTNINDSYATPEYRIPALRAYIDWIADKHKQGVSA